MIICAMCDHLAAEFVAKEFVLCIYSCVFPLICCLVHYFSVCDQL